MTVTITKTRLAISIVALALLAPTAAFASHRFDDVPDDKFYAEPVSWAATNDITTGKTADTFDPDGNVTRGEAVTFLKRYNDNIVEPANEQLLAEVETAIDISAGNTDAIASLSTTVTDTVASVAAYGTAIEDAVAEVSGLDTAVDANTAGLAALTAAVGTNTSDIAGVETTANDNATDITAVQTTAADNAADITAVGDTANDNATDISDNATAIAALQTAIAPLVNSTAAFVGGNSTVAIADTSDVVVQTVSLTPPADGIVLVTASGNGEAGASGGAFSCSLSTTSATDTTSQNFTLPAATGEHVTVALTRGQAVTSGVPLTLNLVCNAQTGSGNILDAAMTAVFAPS